MNGRRQSNADDSDASESHRSRRHRPRQKMAAKMCDPQSPGPNKTQTNDLEKKQINQQMK